MSESTLNCPVCDGKLETGFLYVRGMFTALFWSDRADTGSLSRKHLRQIALDKISTTGTGAQAVIQAARCPDCDSVTFRAS